jgi:adenylosuccinate synthase
VARLSELVGLPIGLISLGPQRRETILKHDPFAA